MKELKEAIKWAEDFRDNFKEGVDKVKELGYADKNLKILIDACNIIEQSGELPGRKDELNIHDKPDGIEWVDWEEIVYKARGFNKCYDIFYSIYANQRLKIYRLNFLIGEKNKDIVVWTSRVEELQKELTEEA